MKDFNRDSNFQKQMGLTTRICWKDHTRAFIKEQIGRLEWQSKIECQKAERGGGVG